MYAAAWYRRDPTILPEVDALAERALAERDATVAVRLVLARSRLLRALGRPSEAAAMMDRALALAEEVGVDLASRVSLLNYRAVVAIDAGSLPEALAPAMQAWMLARDDLPDLAGVAAANLGMCLVDLGDLDGARRWLGRAVWDGQPPFSVAHVALGWALVAWRSRDLSALDEPLARLASVQIPDPVGARRVSGMRALAAAWRAVLSSDAMAALEFVARGRADFGSQGNLAERAELALAAAEAHRLAGDVRSARAAVDAGLALRPDGVLVQQLHELGGALALADDVRTAAAHFRTASRLSGEARVQLGRALVRSLERIDLSRHGLRARIDASAQELYNEVQERKHAEKRALAAVEAKSRFMAAMSHELRTPLNAILGYTELLAEEPAVQASEDAAGDLAHIRDSGNRLLSLIDDLLELTRTDNRPIETTLESVDVEQLLYAVRERFPEVSVRSEVDQPLMSDGPRLEQLVCQLVRSALERGGPVNVRAFDGPEERVHIEVVDSGPEVSRTSLARIDNPFGPVEPSRPDGGVSLALAVARALCASLLGRFEATSGANGTRIVVSFSRPRSTHLERS